MAKAPSKELVQFLKPFDRSISELALALRRLVIEEMAPCHENIYDAYNALALGYGTTDRLKDGICHIAVYAHHVNLGFNHGATLADPHKVLLGSGKKIRHITVKDPSDLKRPELRTYLRSARKQAKHVASKGKSNEVVSTVKAIYPVRRRPS